MNAKRELVLVGPVFPVVRRSVCGATPAVPAAGRNTLWFGDVFPLEQRHRPVLTGVLAVRNAGRFWETIFYVALWGCGLVGIALCFV